MAELQFQLCHAPLQFHQLHVQGGLLCLQVANLLLDPLILRLLPSIMSLHLGFHFFELCGESLVYVRGLGVEDLLKRLLL